MILVHGRMIPVFNETSKHASTKYSSMFSRKDTVFMEDAIECRKVEHNKRMSSIRNKEVTLSVNHKTK